MFPRSLLAGFCLALAAYAAPALTTIQDVLYKADGTRFNGTLTISWSSFQAADNSAIVTQSTTVKVLDGNLRVQLVPAAGGSPPSNYSVAYNSDGRIQFRETWSVPASPRALRLRDVRVAGGSAGGSSAAPDTASPAQEADVVGLLADLGARPVKGPGFAPGRAAVVDSSGLLSSATGAPTDCLRVDGSSGPCGDAAPSFTDADSPGGVVDGFNTTFTLAAAPNPASSLALYRNGVLQKAGIDLTLSGQTVQFAPGAVPKPGDTLLASYRLGGSAGSSGSGGLAYPVQQVLCSGTGVTTNSPTLTILGTCFIPGGTLLAGDRVQISFDLAHQGTAAGFTFEVDWGGTVALHRTAAAADSQVAGRLDGSILNGGAQLSTQSWGTALALAASVGSAADTWSGGLTIFLQASASGGDTVALSQFSVVRLP